MKTTKILMALALCAAIVAPLAAADSDVLVVKAAQNAYFSYKQDGGGYSAMQPLQKDMLLKAGVRLKTGDGGWLRLGFVNDDKPMIQLRNNTVADVEDLVLSAGQNKASFYLGVGRMRAMVNAAFGNNFEVRTRTAVAGVRGTDFGVEFDEGAADGNVLVFDGKVSVQTADEAGKRLGVPLLLAAGQKIGIPAGFLRQVQTFKLREARLFGAEKNDIKTDGGNKGDGADNKDGGNKTDGTKTDGNKSVPDGTKKTDGTKTDGTKTDANKSVSKTSSDSGWGGGIGPEVIDGKTWTKMLLAPRFKFGKFTLALYLPIYYDANLPMWEYERWYNASEYDFHGIKDAIHDLLLKFMFVQYGEKNIYGDSDNKFFFRLGNNDDFIVGHGFIMNHYNNMIQFPQVRTIGGQLDWRIFSWLGFESMVDDVYNAKLFGGRLYLKPFGGIIKELAFGFTYLSDVAPTGKATDKPLVYATGIDVDLPMPTILGIEWILFADYARLGYKINGTYTAQYVSGTTTNSVAYGERSMTLDNGYGLTYGLKMSIWGLVKIQAAYRLLQKGFIPEYFDAYYQTERKAKVDEFLAAQREDFSGVLVEAMVDFGKAGYVKLNFQEYGGKEMGMQTTQNMLHWEMVLNKGIIPKFHASFWYDRSHVIGKELFKNFFGDDTYTTTRLYYEVSDGIDIVGTYRRAYFVDKATGVAGYNENYGIETQFVF